MTYLGLQRTSLSSHRNRAGSKRSGADVPRLYLLATSRRVMQHRLEVNLGICFAPAVTRCGNVACVLWRAVSMEEFMAGLASLDYALRFFKSILPKLPPRSIHLVDKKRPRRTLYTDASWEVAHSDGNWNGSRLLGCGFLLGFR